MASPASLGGSLSSLGGSFGAGGSLTGHRVANPEVNTHISRAWTSDLGQARRCQKETATFLESRLQQLAKDREPSEADGAVRQATIDRLRALLPTIFPAPSRLQLVPYGSFLSSCYSHGSDLDLALAGTVVDAQLAHGPAAVLARGGWTGEALPLESLAEPDWVALLRRLADQLEAQGVTRGPVTRILEARVPIIKFVEASSGIECDICVTTRGCDFKGSVMRLMHGLQPSLAPLIRLVKLWAKQHDINSAHCGTLNSWSLALMALFSLQAYPDGALLPPLWRIFHDQEPGGAAGAGRPLQDKNMALDAMLEVATSKCEVEGSRLLHPRWSETSPPGLLEQLLWFLSAFTAITGQWRDNAAHRNWRVSPWLGRGYTARFPRSYVAAVEEPFDCNDNTARSVGVRERNENTLPYIAWVFGHSVHLLRNVVTVTDAARSLLWLFGPDALPCVGLTQLQVSAGGLPVEQLQRLERLAARRRSGAGVGPGGAQGQDAAEEGEARAFRALIDALKAGSPIMSLDEWRQHHAVNRSRPPHAWHRLALPARHSHAAPLQRMLPPQPPPPPPQQHQQHQQPQPQRSAFGFQPEPLLPQHPQHQPQAPHALIPQQPQQFASIFAHLEQQHQQHQQHYPQQPAEPSQSLFTGGRSVEFGGFGYGAGGGAGGGGGGGNAGQALLEALRAGPARDTVVAATDRADAARAAASAALARVGLGPATGPGALPVYDPLGRSLGGGAAAPQTYGFNLFAANAPQRPLEQQEQHAHQQSQWNPSQQLPQQQQWGPQQRLQQQAPAPSLFPGFELYQHQHQQKQHLSLGAGLAASDEQGLADLLSKLLNSQEDTMTSVQQQQQLQLHHHQQQQLQLHHEQQLRQQRPSGLMPPGFEGPSGLSAPPGFGDSLGPTSGAAPYQQQRQEQQRVRGFGGPPGFEGPSGLGAPPGLGGPPGFGGPPGLTSGAGPY